MSPSRRCDSIVGRHRWRSSSSPRRAPFAVSHRLYARNIRSRITRAARCLAATARGGCHRQWGLPTLPARAAAMPCHLAGFGVQPRSMSAVRAYSRGPVAVGRDVPIAPQLWRGNAAPKRCAAWHPIPSPAPLHLPLSTTAPAPRRFGSPPPRFDCGAPSMAPFPHPVAVQPTRASHSCPVAVGRDDRPPPPVGAPHPLSSRRRAASPVPLAALRRRARLGIPRLFRTAWHPVPSPARLGSPHPPVGAPHRPTH